MIGVRGEVLVPHQRGVPSQRSAVTMVCEWVQDACWSHTPTVVTEVEGKGNSPHRARRGGPRCPRIPLCASSQGSRGGPQSTKDQGQEPDLGGGWSQGGGLPGRWTCPHGGVAHQLGNLHLQSNNVRERVLAQRHLSLFYDLERNPQGHLIIPLTAPHRARFPATGAQTGLFLTANFMTSMPLASVCGEDT